MTEGSFGEALGKFTEIHFEDQEKRLEEELTGSSTFMQMAEKLDAQVRLPGESPILGVRRIIQFVGATAPNFLPREAPENASLIDYLYVLWPFETFGIARALTEEELDSIADSIVHETKHLYEYVNGPGRPAPASAMDAIASGVTEERNTRRTETRAQQEMIDAGVRTPVSAPTTDPQRIAALEGGQSRALIERSLTGIVGLTTYLEAFTLSYLQGKEAGEMEPNRIRLAHDLASKLSNIIPMSLNDSLEHWSAYTLYSNVYLATTEHLKEGLDEHFLEYMTQVLVGLLFTKRWREFSDKTSTIGLSLDEYVESKEAILIGHAALLSERAPVRYTSL
ncbi:MAG: hypothetical protein OEM32_08755 [Acidimicrobiia bacterium]|nr:hypothetical protein [Acidimicrobiia bacterium]